jgi:hypothetical protein
MPKDDFGPISTPDNVTEKAHAEESQELASAPPLAASEADNHAAVLAATERDQLARDMAEIERAAAALRKAQPDLESWTGPPTPAVGKPRPVWLLIGALWISTALVTIGAVVAIHALVG